MRARVPRLPPPLTHPHAHARTHAYLPLPTEAAAKYRAEFEDHLAEMLDPQRAPGASARYSTTTTATTAQREQQGLGEVVGPSQPAAHVQPLLGTQGDSNNTGAVVHPSSTTTGPADSDEIRAGIEQDWSSSDPLLGRRPSSASSRGLVCANCGIDRSSTWRRSMQGGKTMVCML